MKNLFWLVAFTTSVNGAPPITPMEKIDCGLAEIAQNAPSRNSFFITQE
jgi:hypothetical protein